MRITAGRRNVTAMTTAVACYQAVAADAPRADRDRAESHRWLGLAKKLAI